MNPGVNPGHTLFLPTSPFGGRQTASAAVLGAARLPIAGKVCVHGIHVSTGFISPAISGVSPGFTGGLLQLRRDPPAPSPDRARQEPGPSWRLILDKSLDTHLSCPPARSEAARPPPRRLSRRPASRSAPRSPEKCVSMDSCPWIRAHGFGAPTGFAARFLQPRGEMALTWPQTGPGRGPAPVSLDNLHQAIDPSRTPPSLLCPVPGEVP
jgi:hypothetical protein